MSQGTNMGNAKAAKTAKKTSSEFFACFAGFAFKRRVPVALTNAVLKSLGMVHRAVRS